MKTLQIDQETYLKTRVNRLREGYNTRPNVPYRSIIIHTTNGNAGTTFHNEALFLQRSKNVGAHYLVGKNYEIANIVPLQYQAYHTGQTRDNLLYANAYAIGIEVHFTPLEKEWNEKMWYALTYLVRNLPVLKLKTHRYIATPPGRKIDPSGVSDRVFDFWAHNIFQDWVMIETTTININYRLAPELDPKNVIRKLQRGERFIAFKTTGESVNGNNVWYATPEGYLHDSVVKEVDPF